MHVALVHMRHALSGGAEQVLDRLAGHLARSGHEVTIVCRTHARPPEPEVHFVELRSPAVGSAGRMWRFAKDVEQHVPGAGYDVVLGLGKTWTHDVLRTSWTHGAYIEHARHFAKRPLERWLHADWLKNRMAREIERRALAPGAYKRVIANSQRTKLDLVESVGVPAEAIEVVHNGVDLERFHPALREECGTIRGELGLDPRSCVVGFIGTGFGRKGLDRLLEAMPRLVTAVPETQLLVVGRDSRMSAWQRKAERLGVSSRVVFVGERHDPERCYAACDVAVLPTHYDTFAFTVPEALAVGLPVLTTDRAGASELLKPHVHGDVLPHDCGPEELADALAAWCGDPERRTEARQPCRARAESIGIGGQMAKIEAILAAVAAERVARVEG